MFGDSGSSTLHVLGLGQHELEAVLLVDVLVSSSTSHTQGESFTTSRPN